MTTEQMKAFTTWWSKSSIGCDKGPVCREAFASGWEAHAAARADSRTGKQRSSEREAAEQAARQIEQADFKRRFLALASTAFLAGHDAEANIYRNLASHL